MTKKAALLKILLVFILIAAAIGSAQAKERWPSSELLLPCFEVRLDGSPTGPPSLTTYVAVVNAAHEAVPVRISVLSNWGVEVFTTEVTLEPDAVGAYDLAAWLIRGELPDRTLTADELEHVKMALCGDRSPQDGNFYSTPMADPSQPPMAMGSLRIEALGNPKPDALWGDFFVVGADQVQAEGEILHNLDPAIKAATNDDDLCGVHGFRFLQGAGFDAGTAFMVWNPSVGEPSADGNYPMDKIAAVLSVYNQQGQLLETRDMELIPLEMVAVRDLDLPAKFGWLKLDTLGMDTFIAVRHSSGTNDSLMLEAFCLEREGGALDIQKTTNKVDADRPPGPRLAVGSAVNWSYVVTNTGNVALTGVTVSDSDPSVDVVCGGDALLPGESLDCEAHGVAVACQYHNVGRATATTPSGAAVNASDPSHYFGTQGAGITIEKSTLGEDADQPPGPNVAVGATVTWTYVVANTGPTTLTDVVVRDSDPEVAVSCPQQTLEPGESMECAAEGVASLGQYANVGTVRALAPCSLVVTAEDPSHYFGKPPGIAIEKSVSTEDLEPQDADDPPGPYIPVGSSLTWTFVVSNIGEMDLVDVAVTDNVVGPVTCYHTNLAVGEKMTCTAQGVALAGQHTNIATVTAKPPGGPSLSDEDPCHYFGEDPSIGLEKATVGEDADTPPGPWMTVGVDMGWTFVATNKGNVPLVEVSVSDDKEGEVSCPKTVLAVGESMTCTLYGTAVAGQYANLGSVVGRSPSGQWVHHSDPSHYFGQQPDIALEKATNGEDADTPPGPTIFVGEPVYWTYQVSNVGNMALLDLVVHDDHDVVIACPAATLAVGASMTCTGQGVAVAGQYHNEADVTGLTESGLRVTAIDPSHYYGDCGDPAISLEKRVNGEDADTADEAAQIPPGEPVVYTFEVTNTGNVRLSSIALFDDKLGPITCPATTLAAGESMTCTFTMTAAKCVVHENTGTVTGTSACDVQVSASDKAFYTNEVSRHDEGCTPGYWKQAHHLDSWPPTGLVPSQRLKYIFTSADAYSEIRNRSLLEALSFGGGPSLDDKARILLRAAVAALLNARHPDVDYPFTPENVVSWVNAALDSQDGSQMLTLASTLDEANNGPGNCPLN